MELAATTFCAWVVPRYDRELAALVARERRFQARLRTGNNDRHVRELAVLARDPSFWTPEPIRLAAGEVASGNHRTTAALYYGAVFRDVVLYEIGGPLGSVSPDEQHLPLALYSVVFEGVRGAAQPTDLTPRVLARAAEWGASGPPPDERRRLIDFVGQPQGGVYRKVSDAELAEVRHTTVVYLGR